MKIHLITVFTFQTIEKKGWHSWIHSVVYPIFFFDFNNDQLTEILLYDIYKSFCMVFTIFKEDPYNINNASILDATIIFLIETKKFDAQLFWCSSDVMALTLILHLKFIFFFFLFCFVFIIFIFLLFLSNFLYVICIFFFVPRYITIYICIPGDCKFF